MRQMMQTAGKITRLHKALRIELEAREGGNLVIGAADARNLIDHGEGVPLYQVTRTADVDTIERVGSAYMSRSGKGIALRIDVGMPVLPTLYASKAQVEDVYRGFRTAAVVSAPADLSPQPEERKATDRPTLKRGFGDAGNPPRRPAPSPVVIV
jgi:hypothetical protein